MGREEQAETAIISGIVGFALELPAKGFGAEEITITFIDVEPLQAGVNHQSHTINERKGKGKAHGKRGL